MIRVAKLLLDKEVLMREDLQTVLGVRPFEEKRTYEDMINEMKKPTEKKNVQNESASPNPNNATPQQA